MLSVSSGEQGLSLGRLPCGSWPSPTVSGLGGLSGFWRVNDPGGQPALVRLVPRSWLAEWAHLQPPEWLAASGPAGR